ncbi:MAG TPA: DUF503 family protein [Campylobacteraceae bacterium]|jgi:uncharacterized protein YlxP (DUF503 family)|nr:DUF503 family protein [Campylobacteraceae bacterium]
MTILNGYIDIHLPHVSSLKGRRAILNAIKERLRKYNLSQLDISGEYPKEATIAIIFLAPDSIKAQQQIEKIESQLESSFPEIEFEITYEMS